MIASLERRLELFVSVLAILMIAFLLVAFQVDLPPEGLEVVIGGVALLGTFGYALVQLIKWAYGLTGNEPAPTAYLYVYMALSVVGYVVLKVVIPLGFIDESTVAGFINWGTNFLTQLLSVVILLPIGPLVRFLMNKIGLPVLNWLVGVLAYKAT